MNTPTYLVGPPGIGKTALAFAVARNESSALSVIGAAPAEREVIYLPLSERDPMEIAGASYIRDGVCAWAESEATRKAKDRPCVVILDELTAAHRVQRVAALRYADPSAGLHRETVVIATGNPPDYAAGAGDPLTAPEISRFRVLRRDANPAIRWLCGQSEARVREVGGYLRSHPSAAVASPEAMRNAVDRQEPFPTPRTWHRAALSGLALDDWSGFVGESAVAGFLAWSRSQDLPDPLEILAGRCTDVPQRPDGALATATALVEMLGEDATDAAVDYAIDWLEAAGAAGHVGIVACEANVVCARYARLWVKAARQGRVKAFGAVGKAAR